jgi:endonuclease/exonuclease/phosphatase family metal-dependent hydrolase
MRRKKWFSISLIMIMTLSPGFTHSSDYTYPTTQYQVQVQELKILSWNVYLLPFIGMFHNNLKRASIIADSLNNSAYNIIVFQEAFSNKSRRLLAEKLRQKYPFQYGPANQNQSPFRTSSGLWVVSNIPLIKLDEIQFSQCKGFDAVAKKGAVLFEGHFNGTPFQVLATHLQAENRATLRETQCEEIRDRLLIPYSKANVPQFLCGDFNIDMDDTPSYNQMLKTLDARNGELSGTIHATYDERQNNLAYSPNGKKRIIDYVLVRNENLVHTIERKIQTFFTHTETFRSNLSDHYAMEFSVKFNDQASDLQLASSY